MDSLKLKSLTASEIISLLEAPQDLEAIQEFADWGKIHPDSAIDRMYRVKNEAPISEIIAALRTSHHFRTRCMLCQILGWRKAKSSLPALVACLDDDSPEVREEAADNLPRLGTLDAGPPMLKHFIEHESDSSIRFTLARGMGALRYEPAVPYLIEALSDRKAGIRSAAIYALGRLQSELAIEPIIKLLKDRNSTVRYDAARALAAIHAHTAISALEKALAREHREPCIREMRAALVALKQSVSEGQNTD